MFTIAVREGQLAADLYVDWDIQLSIKSNSIDKRKKGLSKSLIWIHLSIKGVDSGQFELVLVRIILMIKGKGAFILLVRYITE